MSVTLFKALSDNTRIRLVRILLQHELSVNDLVAVLHIGQSRISRHLRVLTDAELLASRRDGLRVYYHACKEGPHQDFLEAVAPFLEDVAEAPDDTARAIRVLEESNARTRRFFDENAEKWDSLNQEILGDFDLPRAVGRALPADCRFAVDLGCGTGAVLVHMLKKSRQVAGVDGSQAMLDLCHRRFDEIPEAKGRLSLRIGELAHLPLCDQEADFASINLVLHHLEKPEQALQEARRILSPKGRLFVCEFLKHNDETMRTQYGDRWLGFEEGKLAIALREAGFTRTVIHRQKVGRGLTLLLITSFADAEAAGQDQGKRAG